MPITITMPALSPTMEEGKLAKWLVKEGDTVKSGDVLAEIETDKATMEVEAVDEGTVAKLMVAAGTEGVKVNAVIAILAGEGEDVGAASSSFSPLVGEMSAKPTEEGAQPATAALIATQTPATLSLLAAPAVKPEGARTFASPLARRIAKDAGVDVAKITGSGPKGRVVKSDVDAAISGGIGKATAAAQTVLLEMYPGTARK